MEIKNSVVLVTGANRGLGEAFARAALARGARKVYAGARQPESIRLTGVQSIRLDVTRQEEVDAVVAGCRDVTLLINNAGIARLGGFLVTDSVDAAREQLETNYFGPLRLSQAFAPVLGANGGGAILNVLSIASWVTSPMLAVYASTKSAAWSLTNALRHELRGQHTQVLGLHMGFVDTDLTRGLEVQKSTPEAIVQRALDALEAGAEEVLADAVTQQVKYGLSADAPVYLSELVR